MEDTGDQMDQLSSGIRGLQNPKPVQARGGGGGGNSPLSKASRAALTGIPASQGTAT